MMAKPRPMRTFRKSLSGTSARWPGRDTRRKPVIAQPDAEARPSYRSSSLITPCLVSSAVLTDWTKPSSRRISAMRTLMFERGHSTVCLRAWIPLRRRARKSAIGSVIDIVISSPARLDHAKEDTAEREHTEAETAHLDLAQVRARPATALAAALDTNLELVLLRKPVDQLAHAAAPVPVAVGVGWRNGIPRCTRSARPSASVFAVVTMLMFMPLLESILSYSISGKMICSRTPMVKLPRPSNPRGDTPRKSRTRGSAM